MIRQLNKTTANREFDPVTIELVWQKGTVVPGLNPTQYRKDACGAWIQRDQYGKTGDHGWEIDHIVPVAKGGSDHLSNLQPLLWSNNRHKGDNWPTWTCAVRAVA